MYIAKVISFKGAWEEIFSKHLEELNDLMLALDNLMYRYNKKLIGKDNVNILEEWRRTLEINDWKSQQNILIESEEKVLSIKEIGLIKNNLSVNLPRRDGFLLNWLFNASTIAIRNGIIKYPILLVPTADIARVFYKRPMLSGEYFELYEDQLDGMIPLNHPYPFLIIGYTNYDSEIVVRELQGTEASHEVHKVIDRCIEFPPEYHVAGLNILNFFGTYLREQYPGENAKVKIEQDGLIVRLIVESPDGKSEVIEKALQEYQLIVTGQEIPESIINNDKLIIELKQELGMAALRVETYKNTITIQNAKLTMQDETIRDFKKFLELSLLNNKSINIEVNPTITSSNQLSMTFNFSEVLLDIKRLKSALPINNEELKELLVIEEAISSIEKETNPNVVKHSNAMSKLEDFIKKFSEGSKKVDNAMAVGKKAWDAFQKLAGTYNGIAEWCGLPQVPRVFTK